MHHVCQRFSYERFAIFRQYSQYKTGRQLKGSIQMTEANFRTFQHYKYQKIMIYCITIYGLVAHF